MKLYTRTGDQGTTGTLVGRVGKDSLQVAALGALDTLHAHLAVVFEEAYRTPLLSPVLETYLKVQIVDAMHDLLDLGTHVSALSIPPPTPFWWCALQSPPTTIRKQAYEFRADHFPLEDMEQRIDAMCNSTPELTSFILHTGSVLTAHVHVARTSCRAAEASVVAFLNQGHYVEERDQFLLRYLNRLSDYLFALARLCTHVQEGVETTH